MKAVLKSDQMDPIEKLRMIFLEPTLFFRQVKNEKKYLPILLFFFAAYILSSLVSFIFKFMGIKADFMKFGTFFPIIMFFLFLFVLAIAFVAPFIGAGMSHLGIMTVGGAGKFFDTFKASTYASVLSPFYTIILEVIGYFSPFDIKNPAWPDFLNTYTLLWVIIAVISAVHIFYVECTGLSQYHKISKIRSLAAILFIPIILLIILVIFIILFAFMPA